MRLLPTYSPKRPRTWLFVALPLAAIVGSVSVDAMRAPAGAEQEIGYGSNNPSFRRHFWRGQAYHGPNGDLGGGLRHGGAGLADRDAPIDGRT